MTLIKRQELEFQKLDEVNLVLLLGKVSKGSRNKADSRWAAWDKVGNLVTEKRNYGIEGCPPKWTGRVREAHVRAGDYLRGVREPSQAGRSRRGSISLEWSIIRPAKWRSLQWVKWRSLQWVKWRSLTLGKWRSNISWRANWLNLILISTECLNVTPFILLECSNQSTKIPKQKCFIE